MAFPFSQFWRKLGKRINDLGSHEEQGKLGDFTTTPRVLFLSLFAMVIGALGAFVALILLRLIGLFTNLFFFQRWDTTLVSPAGNHLGIFEIFVPIIGGLLVGLMARYGSERIRGHGIANACFTCACCSNRAIKTLSRKYNRRYENRQDRKMMMMTSIIIPRQSK